MPKTSLELVSDTAQGVAPRSVPGRAMWIVPTITAVWLGEALHERGCKVGRFWCADPRRLDAVQDLPNITDVSRHDW